MKTELKARMGNRTDLDARMDRWLNYSFFEILLNPRFQFFEIDQSTQFDTTVGLADYELDFAPDLWFILDVRDVTNERKLRRSHWSYIDKISTNTGQPTRYYRFKTHITLDPTPDMIYRIQMRYRRRPNDLASGTMFEGLGTEWEEPIVTMASIKGFEALKLTSQAAEQRQLLEGMLASRSDVPGLEDFDSETGIEVSMLPRIM